MSLPYILRDEAQAEYDEAFDYYAAIRLDLAEEFEAQADAVFALVAANPRIGGEVAPGVRRFPFRKLRYMVFYTEIAGVIEVIAVFHASRDPAEWQGRV